MTGEQWQQTVRVMKLKWPNFHWTNEQVKSAYESLKDIEIAFIEKAIEQSFKAGTDFAPNPSSIYATSMEIQRYEWNDPSVQQLPAPKGGLKEYLLANEFESFVHAMYDFAQKRFQNGTQEKYEVGTFDYTKSWEEAKANYSDRFGNGVINKIFTQQEEVNDGVS
jgi:hypothetical protein